MADSAFGGGWHPLGTCSLFLCDIASFGSETRTDDARAHVRSALYASLRTAFEDSSIAPADCYGEDRGDGAMIVVPPDVATARLLASVVERLRARVRRHNRLSSEAARMRLRLAVHVGEVRWDGNGLVGTAVNHAFRLLDAPAFKAVFEEAGTDVALIVSDRVHEDVVRHELDLVDPEEYAPIDVRVKETSTTAWFTLPGRPHAARALAVPARPPAVRSAGAAPEEGWAPPPPGGTANLFELVDRALEIPLMATERGRQQVVGALPLEIMTVIPRSPDARSDTYEIIRTCLDYPGGLQGFVAALRGFVGDSMALNRLEQAIARLLLQP